MIHFLLNIDGIIAERNTSVFIALCNKELKLGIDEARLQTLPYPEFLMQPEVISYRQRIGERNFERALGWIELDPHHQIHMRPLKDAVAGVSRLANMGSLAYYTTRKTAYSTQLNVQMAQATRAWLTMHHFPDPDHVLFCSSPQDKVCKITENAVKNSYHLIVIDAYYEQLLVDLSSLSQFLLKKLQYSLTLYAFGVLEVVRSSAIEVIAFPSWEHTDACIEEWTHIMERRFAMASPPMRCWR